MEGYQNQNQNRAADDQVTDSQTPVTNTAGAADYYSYGQTDAYTQPEYSHTDADTGTYTGDMHGSAAGNTGYTGGTYGSAAGNTGYTRSTYGSAAGDTGAYTGGAYGSAAGDTGTYTGGAYGSVAGNTGTYTGDMYGSAAGDTDTRDENAYADSNDGIYRPYEEPVKPKKNRGFGKKLVKCAALGLTFGVLAAVSFAGTTHFFGTVTGGTTEAGKEDVLSGGNLNIAEATETVDPGFSQSDGSQKLAAEGAVTDVSDIVDQVMPSIVSITTIARTQVPSFFFGGMQEYESEGCGSGIIISQDEENLYIATNNHVVEGAETLTVLFADDNTVSAQIKGTDPSSDLAVVSVVLDDIPAETRSAIRTATFGDSGNLKVGQTAIAIGNALGYGQSVTTGVISALDREVTVTNEMDGSASTNALLQTDAAINPGNSGGALLNLNGEVIGINSVKYSETSVEGMGYAIPSGTAIPIIRQLITREIVEGSDSAYLGISGVDVTQSVSDTYHMPQGVYVAQVVEGSGAANAGIMQGDIITRFDGRNIRSSEEMEDLMQYITAGETVEMTIQRAVNGEYVEQNLQVTLGSKK